MTRPRLRRPEQPLVIRFLLGLYELAASLQLAVLLIASLAVVLVVATMLESHYGDKSRAINEGIYETWWFALLNGLLGLNVLCAALIRFPWKRKQTGFVVTHAGILLLLVGSAVTRGYGIDATLPVYEGQSQWQALENSQHFRLSIFNEADPGAATGTVQEGSHPRVIELPFAAGPFNWDDYRQRPWFPGGLSRWNQGVLYDRDGIKLEVVDYLSDSRELSVPQVTIVAATRAPSRGSEMPEAQRVTLDVRSADPHVTLHGSSEVKTLAGGQNVCFWMTGNAEETQAFARTLPEGPLSGLGQIVLYHAGKTYRFAVDKLKSGKRQPLGDSGLGVELQKLEGAMMAAKLQIYRGRQPGARMVLVGDQPQYSVQDDQDRVFGAYWFDPPADAQQARAKGIELGAERLAQWAAPRIDLLQGADLKLHCRVWRPGQPGSAVTLPADGQPLLLWENTPFEVALRLDEFHPSDTVGRLVVPVEYNGNLSMGEKQRRARVVFTVDGQPHEFWLAGLNFADPVSEQLAGSQRRIVSGAGRRVALTLSLDAVDVGFQVHLQKFVRKLDPGSGAPSYFASVVDFLDRRDPQKKLRSDVLITLNEPVNFSDPDTGRSFRLYQASFSGPFGPGDEPFEQIVGGRDAREQLYQSNFSANYDPGRPWKYAGSLLIVAGILIIFYMKAYFFARRESHSTTDKTLISGQNTHEMA